MHDTLFPLGAGHHGESRGGDTAHIASYQLGKASRRPQRCSRHHYTPVLEQPRPLHRTKEVI